ncbi:hypothetical protein IAG44_39365 [Streptomyces roseirectus]|uniref:Uncharacterized protein n=1 Tax=Streptomyces roseirectus TaxID=2768066 RepID=A0A7H0ITX1_9ACTN|nr:hypothetical protein [Streptomyces roseirectus]QNP76237.1 hypothetical protein IAG44_39365 [Streptomyces roseirectus]
MRDACMKPDPAFVDWRAGTALDPAERWADRHRLVTTAAPAYLLSCQDGHGGVAAPGAVTGRRSVPAGARAVRFSSATVRRAG